MELKRKVLYKAIEAGIMTAPTCIYASYAYIQIRTRKLVQEINSINNRFRFDSTKVHFNKL